MILFAIIISITWAITTVFNRYALKDMHIMTWYIITVLIMLIAALIVFPLYKNEIVNDFKKNRKLILLSLLALVLYTVIGHFGYYYVLKHAPNINSIIPILYTSPLFVIIIAYFTIKEELNIGVAIGCLLIVFGAMIIGYCEMK